MPGVEDNDSHHTSNGTNKKLYLKIQLKGSMQQRHNFIFLKIYSGGDFTDSDHVTNQILINNIIHQNI